MEVVTEDGCFFSCHLSSLLILRVPTKDCCCLPLVHSSAEELARYIVWVPSFVKPLGG